LKTNISGWGNFPISAAILSRPERYHQLKIGHEKTIARGLGRSYGDAALNSNHRVLLMERLNRFLSFDSTSGVLRTEAGVSLEEILETFVPRGWFLPVTPGTKKATLGGCLATDVHGKNHHRDGTIGDYVREIELITAEGSHHRCSPNQKADLFWATIGGMGLTGVIAEAALQLIPIESAFIQATHRSTKNFEETLDLLEDTSSEDHYSVAWVDCLSKGDQLGRSIVMTGHHASLRELPSSMKEEPFKQRTPRTSSIPFYFPSWVLNPWSIKVFNSLYHRFQSGYQEPFFTDYNRFFYPLDSINGWNKCYGKRGFLQYQFVIPPHKAREAIHEILLRFTLNQHPPFLAVLKRFGKEGKGLLSFPQKGYTLALDLPISSSLWSFLDEVDEMVLKYEGRLYLAKDARMKPHIFRAMYPRFDKWLAIKTQVDPQYVLSSDLSRRLRMENDR
jgi:FAD/FMN-containing dehydrogenase